MKFWKWMLKCPMLFLLTAGWAGLTIYTWSEGKLTFAFNHDLIENPAFTALLQPEEELTDSVLDDHEDAEGDEEKDRSFLEQMQILADENGESGSAETTEDLMSSLSLTEKKQENPSADGGTDSSQKDKAPASKSTEKDGKTPDDAKKQGQAAEGGKENAGGKTQTAGVTKFKKYQKIPTDSPYYSDPGKRALTTSYDYQTVDKSYFDDAVFIGDSRTVGMQDYSGLDNADFFAKTGMNVYEVLDDKFIEDPDTGRLCGVLQMLKKKTYGKIYFMVGINELGTGNTGTFQKAYARVIQKFHKYQPDAVIYIQGIIPVSREKASGDAIFNNVNINDKNVAIAQLADGRDVFYLDVSGKLTDKNGYLKEDYTFDEIHMYARHYQVWTDYLMEHAVVR